MQPVVALPSWAFIFSNDHYEIMLVKQMGKVLSKCWLLFRGKKGENMGVAAKVTFLSLQGCFRKDRCWKGSFPAW